MKRASVLLLLLSACSPGDVIRGGAPEGGMPPASDAAMQPPVDSSQPPPGDGDGDVTGDGDGDGDTPPGSDGGKPNNDGFVPVFVAVGYQSHRTVSCDNGLTWPHEEMSPTGGGDDGTLMRGLAYGKHLFVASVGGGGTQEIHVSDDGVTWQKIVRAGNGYSDVAFGNGRFVAGGGHVSVVSSDGYNWGMDGTMGSGGILRNLAFTNYMGGRFAAAGDGGRRMNSKDGVTWGGEVQEGDSLEGIAGGRGVFVAVAASGSTRYSTDGGDTWQSGSIGTSGARGIIHDGARFIVTANSGSYFSENGVDWEPKGGNPGPYDFAVNDDRTHYVGVDADLIMHSTDGIQWTQVKSGGPGYERVKFGWVKASSVCPAP